MQVAKNTVVAIHYTLTGDDGQVIESSRVAGRPIEALIGHGGIIPGLESALIDHAAGDRVEVAVDPAAGRAAEGEGIGRGVGHGIAPVTL